MWGNKYFGSQKIRILTLRWVPNLGVCLKLNLLSFVNQSMKYQILFENYCDKNTNNKENLNRKLVKVLSFQVIFLGIIIIISEYALQYYCKIMLTNVFMKK